MTQKFEMTASVTDRGTITHVISVDDEASAWERFRKAYSKHTCALIRTHCIREDA